MEQQKVKRYRKISDALSSIIATKNKVEGRGLFTGFKVLEPYISFVEGACSTWFGSAGSGKTQMTIECCVNMAKMYEKVTVLYLTEAGNFEETVLDVCQTYLRKKLQYITDEELIEALTWMNKFFFVLDVSESLMDIREIYDSVRDIEKDEVVKVFNVIIDHYHNLNPTKEQKGMTIAESVKYIFQAITRTSKKFNYHTHILFHVKDIDPIKCTTSGKYYLPKPEMYMLSGGMQSSYLSQQMISIWRPITRQEQYGIVDSNGIEYQLNETHVTCMKVKPKISGTLGGAVLKFDSEKQSYYEYVDGVPKFGGEEYNLKQKNKGLKPSALQPNINFGSDDLENPF